MLPTLFFLAVVPILAFAQDSTSTANSPVSTNTDTCDPGHNGLATGTLQYVSDCNSTTFCDSNGVCQPKGCRRDTFPLGYPPGGVKADGWPLPTPDKCDKDSFCPDEGTSCQPLLAVGSDCQLDRDDECEGPPNFKDLRDETGFGLNVNGSICLNFKCKWANVTVGNTCEIENVGYITYGGNSEEYVDIVSRDDCAVGLYCDTSSLQCIQRKASGADCTADKECLTFNCESSKCDKPLNDPHHFGIWVYIVIGVCIFGGIIGTLVALFFIHRRNRDVEREKRLQYWREQNAFRQNIMQMQETARASIFNTPAGGSPRSTMYGVQTEDSQAPMLQNAAPKGSGLRYYVGEDGSENDHDTGDEHYALQSPFNDHKNAF
ncbi:hypothetical protein OF83DRAFT_1116899 [Amylostereum chailletii]|nr:hypothetical protein OF83DRAFT_1116899 [Amylostereum chailletii]